MNESECVLCTKPILPGEKSVILTQKGCDGIQSASEARELDINITPGQTVHSYCRKIHCSQNCIASHNRKRSSTTSVPSNKPSLRSAETLFDYSKHCLFCGISDKYDGRKSDFKLVRVRTYDFQNSVIIECVKRNDDWAHMVQARIESVNDLHASDSVYHQSCSVNFRTRC